MTPLWLAIVLMINSAVILHGERTRSANTLYAKFLTAEERHSKANKARYCPLSPLSRCFWLDLLSPFPQVC